MNLVTNELYREDGTLNDLKETKEKVLAGVRRLSNSTTRLVIVTNEVNADINGYSEETEKYRGMHRNGESKSCRACRYSNGSCVWNSGMHS